LIEITPNPMGVSTLQKVAWIVSNFIPKPKALVSLLGVTKTMYQTLLIYFETLAILGIQSMTMFF